MPQEEPTEDRVLGYDALTLVDVMSYLNFCSREYVAAGNHDPLFTIMQTYTFNSLSHISQLFELSNKNRITK